MNYKTENIPSKELDSNYVLSCNDIPDIRIILTYYNRKKQLDFYDCNDGPKELEDLVSWVWNYQKKMKLNPCFEINPKRKAPPEPEPIVNELKVTPPHISKLK